MSQTQTIKKARSSRTSAAQYTEMVNFFYLNKGLAEGKFNVLHGKDMTRKKWEELAAELNDIQGANKTTEQWQVVWRDLKSRTSMKVRDLRKAKARTGNKSCKEIKLSELDVRVIGLVGADYIEGSTDCVESIPEEESLQNELILGNSSVLKDVPKVLNVSDTFLQENSQDLQTRSDDRDTDMGIGVTPIDHVMMESCNDENGSNIENIPIRPSVKNVKRKMPRIVSVSKPLTDRNINLVQKRSNRIRRSVDELHSAKEQFGNIAQTQADAMMILAEASQTHAEAMTQMAKAAKELTDVAKIQATNDTERIRVMAQLVQVLENILPNYLS